jgi:hypothetical protein
VVRQVERPLLELELPRSGLLGLAVAVAAAGPGVPEPQAAVLDRPLMQRLAVLVAHRALRLRPRQRLCASAAAALVRAELLAELGRQVDLELEVAVEGQVLPVLAPAVSVALASSLFGGLPDALRSA